MAKKCEMCGKQVQVGNLVSHSNIKTKRKFRANIQAVRHQFANGEIRVVNVCTRCIKTGLVQKPLARAKSE